MNFGEYAHEKVDVDLLSLFRQIFRRGIAAAFRSAAS